MNQSARDEAVQVIQSVRNSWWPTPIPAGIELDALSGDLLRRVADERLMADPIAFESHIDQHFDEHDRLTDRWRGLPVDDYQPDDREPMGGDPYWREDDT